MGSKTVSVIIPVYNSPNTIERCVCSVLEQNYQDLEVLLIDDGSTDDSRKVCDFLGEKDSRVRVIHKENGGVCSARNVGLESARGVYNVP